MKSKIKKILALALATVSVGSIVAMSGCSKTAYKGDPIDDYVPVTEDVYSNGGFAVQEGDFVYFINGAEDYTVANEYGEVVKGALMRISIQDLSAGNYDNVKTIVPSLFAAQNFGAGIYIFDGYVYYATPTTDKNITTGEAESDWIDFKRAKLDGSEGPMSDFYFRLSNNASNYRFVKEGEVVYCLYEEDGALKSYDTVDKESRTLVEGAETFYYDTKDATNPNVYYTMGVTMDIDSDNSRTLSYNQLYSVNAAARVEETKTENGKVSYTVKGGKTYSFSEQFLKEKNKEAKDAKQDEPYDFSDYSTFPYVNLGTLVFDGIGSNAVSHTQYNETIDDNNKPAAPDGYTYSVVSYNDYGLYFTRKEAGGNTSSDIQTPLLYLADADKNASDWKAISGNASSDIDVVNADSSLLSGALFTKDGDKHVYYYFNGSVLYKGGDDYQTPIAMTHNVSDGTLWTVENNYLYYYQAWSDGAGNGNMLSRIKVDGTALDYTIAATLDKANVEYEPVTVAGVQWNSSWYKPELFDGVVLYSNEQAIGSVSYNYISAAKLPATQADLVASNEKYEEVTKYIADYEDKDVANAMNYYFQTGKRDLFDEKVSLYEEYQVEEFEAFVAEMEGADKKYEFQSEFFAMVGKVNEADQEAINTAWEKSLLQDTNTDDEKGLETWAIILIVVGSVLVVAGGVVAGLLVLRKKKLAKEKADATVNAYKRAMIDTTDDKTIDVYADDSTEETAQESENQDE